MKSKEGILARTPLKEMTFEYDGSGGAVGYYSESACKTAMDEWADERSIALHFAQIKKLTEYANKLLRLQAERDEYRKALQALADSCINVKYNITKKPLLKFVNQAFSTLNRHPQQ